ncbi:unnamed protein product, partial [marine sediment metagenome]
NYIGFSNKKLEFLVIFSFLDSTSNKKNQK